MLFDVVLLANLVTAYSINCYSNVIKYVLNFFAYLRISITGKITNFLKDML